MILFRFMNVVVKIVILIWYFVFNCIFVLGFIFLYVSCIDNILYLGLIVGLFFRIYIYIVKKNISFK